MFARVSGKVVESVEAPKSGQYKTVIRQAGEDSSLTIFTRERFLRGQELDLLCKVELKKGDIRSYFSVVEL